MTDRDEPLVATASQTVGPFFDFGLTTPNAALGQMAGPDTPGERIRLRIRVYDGDGAVVPDAVVELWQADASGAFPGVWGRQGTNADGECEFHTVRPGRSTVAQAFRPAIDGLPASHINVCLFARGLLRHVFTRVYFAGDPALASDPVLALVPEARRETLLAHPEGRPEGLRYMTAEGRPEGLRYMTAEGRPEGLRHTNGEAWVFDLRLQGDRETVFFDL